MGYFRLWSLLRYTHSINTSSELREQLVKNKVDRNRKAKAARRVKAKVKCTSTRMDKRETAGVVVRTAQEGKSWQESKYRTAEHRNQNRKWQVQWKRKRRVAFRDDETVGVNQGFEKTSCMHACSMEFEQVQSSIYLLAATPWHGKSQRTPTTEAVHSR